MNRVLSTPMSAPVPEASIRRWLPPDVGFEPEVVVEEPPEPPPPPPPTAEEIAAIEEAARAAGHERGYREGHEAGYREGREQAEREAAAERAEREAREQQWRQTEEATLRETVAALEGIARALADPLAESADALEPELLALVAALARRVVMAELATDPELIRRVLHEALQQLPSRKHAIRIQVNPRDQARLAAYAESHDEQLTWIADPEVEPGGCLLVSGPSRIDASLETRLRQGIEAIWGELEPPAPSPPTEATESGTGTDLEPGFMPESAPVSAAETTVKTEPESESDPAAASEPVPVPTSGPESASEPETEVSPA